MNIRLKITGMSCQHCVNHTEKNLKAVSGVQSVQIDLEQGLAEIEGQNIAVHDLIEAVKQAGYSAEVIA